MKIATLQQGHEPSISAVLTGLTRKPFTLTNKPVSMCLLSAFEDNVIGKNTTRVCIDLSAPINLPINCTGGGKTNLQAKKKKKTPEKITSHGISVSCQLLFSLFSAVLQASYKITYGIAQHTASSAAAK